MYLYIYFDNSVLHYRYLPLYCRQTINPITGEHTVIMLREINSISNAGAPTKAWLHSLVDDFRARFRALLAYKFRHLTTELSLSVLDPREKADGTKSFTSPELLRVFTSHDLERLEKYSNNLIDYHLILDLVPRLVRLCVCVCDVSVDRYGQQ